MNGATPLQLVVMLYDGALRFLEAGKHAMVTGDRNRQNDQLQRAQRIVMELMGSLDMEKGGDIAKNLLSLYSYALNEVVVGNMSDDPTGVDRAINVLSGLRDSWAQLEATLAAPAETYELPHAA